MKDNKLYGSVYTGTWEEKLEKIADDAREAELKFPNHPVIPNKDAVFSKRVSAIVENKSNTPKED